LIINWTITDLLLLDIQEILYLYVIKIFHFILLLSTVALSFTVSKVLPALVYENEEVDHLILEFIMRRLTLAILHYQSLYQIGSTYLASPVPKIGRAQKLKSNITWTNPL